MKLRSNNLVQWTRRGSAALSGKAFGAPLTKTLGKKVRVSMSEPIKLIVAPSPHYHQLTSGQIKYQKSKPGKPIWRIVIIDERCNRMHMRFFDRKPSVGEIGDVIFGQLSAQMLLSSDIVIPTTVEKLTPGLREKLATHGAMIYLPIHGFASGSLAGKESDKFLSYLEMSLNMVRERMASCEEIAAATENALGFVTTALSRDEDKECSKFTVADKMAYEITRLRGRDPKIGRKMRDNESLWGPLNEGKHAAPLEDVLSTLLSKPNRLMQEPGLWDIVSQLKLIKDAEPGRKLPLIQKLGVSAVLHQIASIRSGRHWSFLSNLHIYLRDRSLRYLVSFGIKEAFKMLIVLDEGLLQVSAANVIVHYPKDCGDLSLRSIPAHYHIQRMVQKLSGGKIAVLPNLAAFNPETPEFLQGWGPFSSQWFSDRTQINPAKCLIPVSKAGSQKKEGLLIVLAILPQNTRTYVPIGDRELATEMTVFINERLTRNGKGVTCQIGPLLPYGDFMEIGDPPEDLREISNLTEIFKQ